MPFRIGPHAEIDLEKILGWTELHFGLIARDRYEALLWQAFLDLGTDPLRPGSIELPGGRKHIRIYHLRHSKRRAKIGAKSVQHPRHILLYRVLENRTAQIGRILHDGMDLRRHLPANFSDDPEDS